MKKFIKLVSIFALALGLSWQAVASGGGDNSGDTRLKDIAQFNLSDNLGLKGYDPVSYFPEGGGTPLEGSSSLSVDFGGVTYNFANESNMSLFLDEVAKDNGTNKYEPTYGGWCAYAMGVNGSKVDINPELFDFTGDRLNVFADGTRSLWLDDKESLEPSADRRWARILQRARR